MRIRSLRKTALLLFSVLSVLSLLLNGCTLSLLNLPGLSASTATATHPVSATVTPIPAAGVSFRVTLPAPLPAGETLYLSVVDEVTGLDLNPQNFTMQGMDALDYTVNIPFPLNSVIKYRYVRQGTLPTPEADVFGQPVRYRMYFATGPGLVEDVVACWTDTPFAGTFGQLTGHLVDSASNAPIPNILVDVAGQQTLTDSNGAFVFAAVPVGTHNLVAYALDGTYQTFQQGARVDSGLNTPVTFSLNPAKLVNVTFTLTVPANTIKNVPIRMAGSLFQLGNTFGDLSGGLSTVASRMPLLSQLPDGRYTISMMIPAGTDVRYKYTLGDGFWNAEHNTDGSFNLRQFIVPASSNSIQV